MKVPRLLAFVLSFLLVINFFRTVNGTGFVGTVDVLARLDQFEFDLSPVSNLVALWKEENFGSSAFLTTEDSSHQSSVPSYNNPAVGADLVIVPDKDDYQDIYDDFLESEDDGVMDRLVKKIGRAFATCFEFLSTRISSVGTLISNFQSDFFSFGNLFSSIQGSISNKIQLLSKTLSYIWNNGFALLMIPIQLISETFSFSFWLLGFGG